MSLKQFRKQLLVWYSQHQRDLPWRAEKDPYKIWLSEIILQQTRVNQGLPYYTKFIENYPTLSDLAKADETEVLKLWQGLGYYSRARNMLQSAKLIQNNFQGVFPITHNELLRLKGIGDYTASAIASFAFDLPHAVVDGNVMRVITRLFAIEIPIDTNLGKKKVSEKARLLLEKKHPGMFNQAMMELGAMVCTPQNPSCQLCPVSFGCMAYAMKKSEYFPVKQKKKAAKKRFFHYAFLTDGHSVMLQQRGKGDVWQGLFEFPLLESTKDENEVIGYFQGLIKKKIVVKKVSNTIKHLLSHQLIYARFYIMTVSTLDVLDSFVIVPLEKIKDYPVSRLTEKWLQEEGVL